MSVFDTIFAQSTETRRMKQLDMAIDLAAEDATVESIVADARKLEEFVSGKQPEFIPEGEYPPKATPLYSLRAPELDNLYGLLLSAQRGLPIADSDVLDGIAAIEAAVMDRDGPLPEPGKLWKDELTAEERAEEPAPDYPTGVNDSATLSDGDRTPDAQKAA